MQSSARDSQNVSRDYKLRIRPSIILGRLVEGNELHAYEQSLVQHIDSYKQHKVEKEAAAQTANATRKKASDVKAQMRGSATTMTAVRNNL